MNVTDTQIAQVTPDVLLTNLKVCAIARRPLFIWGPPGCGKSDIVNQFSNDSDLDLRTHIPKGQIEINDENGSTLLIDIRASQLDPVDTRGVPFVFDEQLTDESLEIVDHAIKRTGWAIPSFLPSAKQAAKYRLVVIFLDEVNTAPASVQAALYQLILDRRLGDYVLPENVVIFAAGNRETDRAIATRMSSALADRFFHNELIVENDAWIQWAIKHDIHLGVLTYINWRPSSLYQFDPKSPSKSQATLRGWEYVSDVLKVIDEMGINGTAESSLICGKVGAKVGAEFVGFLRVYRRLPDIDELMADPSMVDDIEGIDVKWALCGAVSERASVKTIAAVLDIAKRLGSEFMVLLVNTARLRHPEIMNTPEFIQWASDNSDLVTA